MLAWLAAGEITADEFSMSADADTRGNGYVADKLRMMMMMMMMMMESQPATLSMVYPVFV